MSAPNAAGALVPALWLSSASSTTDTTTAAELPGEEQQRQPHVGPAAAVPPIIRIDDDDDDDPGNEDEHEAPVSGFGLTLVDLVTAALALVAALAWNDLARAVFDRLVPEPRNHLLAQAVYVVTLTLIVVMVMWAFRAAHRLACEAGARAERRLNGPVDALLPRILRERFLRGFGAQAEAAAATAAADAGSGSSQSAVRRPANAGTLDPRLGARRADLAAATPQQIRQLRRQAGNDSLAPSGDGFKTTAVPQGVSGATRCMLGTYGNGPGTCGARRPVGALSSSSRNARAQQLSQRLRTQTQGAETDD